MINQNLSPSRQPKWVLHATHPHQHQPEVQMPLLAIPQGTDHLAQPPPPHLEFYPSAIPPAHQYPRSTLNNQHRYSKHKHNSNRHYTATFGVAATCFYPSDYVPDEFDLSTNRPPNNRAAGFYNNKHYNPSKRYPNNFKKVNINNTVATSLISNNEPEVAVDVTETKMSTAVVMPKLNEVRVEEGEAANVEEPNIKQDMINDNVTSVDKNSRAVQMLNAPAIVTLPSDDQIDDQKHPQEVHSKRSEAVNAAESKTWASVVGKDDLIMIPKEHTLTRSASPTLKQEVNKKSEVDFQLTNGAFPPIGQNCK